MKHSAILFFILMLACIFSGCKKAGIDQDRYSEDIVVYSTPEIYEVASILVKEFSDRNPEVKIEIRKESRSSIKPKLIPGPNLAFVSGELSDDNDDQNLWKEVIGRDIIVPVFNSDNPFSADLLSEGITQAELEMLINRESTLDWSELVGSSDSQSISLYIADDPAVLSGIQKFIGKPLINGSSAVFTGSEDLISSVQSDPYAIGLCKMKSLFVHGSSILPKTLKILPIDKNGNGRVDYVENIYNDHESISRGVWIGKYPRELINNIYTMFAARPSGDNELAFLKWVITDGQQYLGDYGYNDLVYNERLAKLSMIDGLEINIEDQVSYAEVRDPLSFYIYFPIIFTAGIIIVFIVLFVIQKGKEKVMPLTESMSASRPIFNENSIRSPEGLYYDKTHTWAYMEEDGLVKIGIDDFLQHITGPLTRVKLKSPGERVKKGKYILSIIQEGKQLEVYAPVSGTIKEHNKILETDSSLINSSPYKDGWIYKIEPTNWLKEIQFMILGTKYKEWLKNEFTRLKEFLTEYINPGSPKYAYVMQDGGDLKEGVLTDLGPELWEDFQTNFIDASA